MGTIKRTHHQSALNHTINFGIAAVFIHLIQLLKEIFILLDNFLKRVRHIFFVESVAEDMRHLVLLNLELADGKKYNELNAGIFGQTNQLFAFKLISSVLAFPFLLDLLFDA